MTTRTDKLEAHLDALLSKHKKIHKLIEALEAERAPDDVVQRNKIEKLQLKDEIERLQNMVSLAKEGVSE